LITNSSPTTLFIIKTLHCWMMSVTCKDGTSLQLHAWIYNYLCNMCLSPLNLSVRSTLIGRCTRILDTASCNNVCQWHEAGRWFSPDSTVSSINQTDSHGIAELLLNNDVKHHNSNPEVLKYKQLHIPVRPYHED